MAMLDQIGQEKRRICEQLTRLEAERAKLSDHLNELEIAQRAVRRFGGKAAVPAKRSRGHAATTAPANAERTTRGGQKPQGISLGDATLKAVQAHPNGASADVLIKYLSRKFGLAVRPNHLGGALQRHRRAGRLENRDERWHLPRLA
jgi:hypothetical protein